MTQRLVLYGDRPWESPYFFSVFVAAREKGVPFEVKLLDIDRGEQRAGGYPEKSLTARIPCIEHGSFVLSESLAILEYLDDALPAPAYLRLLPEAIEARARARQLLGWVRSDLLPLREERATSTIFFARATTPLSERGRAAADKLLRIADALIPAGEGHLFGTWSIADADLCFMLYRLIANGEPVPERVLRYAAAQWQRPSVRAFVEQPRPAPP